jgi:molybdopterin-binding protein
LNLGFNVDLNLNSKEKSRKRRMLLAVRAIVAPDMAFHQIGGQILTATITNESVDELKLEAGKPAYAIIKASSVMIGVE